MGRKREKKQSLIYIAVYSFITVGILLFSNMIWHSFLPGTEKDLTLRTPGHLYYLWREVFTHCSWDKTHSEFWEKYPFSCMLKVISCGWPRHLCERHLFGANWRVPSGRVGQLPPLAQQHSSLHLPHCMDCGPQYTGAGHRFILFHVCGILNVREENSHSEVCSIGCFLFPLSVPGITSLRPLTWYI